MSTYITLLERYIVKREDYQVWLYDAGAEPLKMLLHCSRTPRWWSLFAFLL